MPAHFSYAADLTWTGTTSSDWATNTNWSTGAVPTAGDNVTIPDATTTNNDPDIANGAICNNLTIANNGILNGNGQQITVWGNWTNGGIFNHGNGTVSFSGDAFSVPTFTPGASSYYGIEVNKTCYNGNYNIIGVSGTATVLGNLTQTYGKMNGGQIDLSGDYIITANASGAYYAAFATTVNFNNNVDQRILYSAGGVGGQIRVDKAAGDLIVSSDLTVAGWTYVQGSVIGLDTYTLTLGGGCPGNFVPGSLVYGQLTINKNSGYDQYRYLSITGTAIVSGNLNHLGGRLRGGQIDLAGNYIVGANTATAYAENAFTIINFNHAVNNQAVSYAAGGLGAHLRIDKAAGTFSLASDVSITDWTYVRGAVSGVSAAKITFAGYRSGVFAPGGITYGGIILNKPSANAANDDLVVGAGNLVVAGSLTVVDGEFNLNANNSAVTMTGHVSIEAAGALGAGSNPITLDGNWTNAGTFNHGNGRIVFRGGVDTTFIPGAASYYDLEVNKYGYDDLNVAGTATVLGDLIQTDGDLGQGQIDLAGDYFITAGSGGGTGYYLSTVVNFNGSGDQAIVYSADGTGAQIRIDKPSGTLTISDDIVICGWSYVAGSVVGYDTHTLIFGDDNHGTFTPGNLTYVNLELRKPGGYSELQFSGTATVTGNFTHTDGELANGQMNLSGNYIVGAAAGGGSNYYNATVINFNGSGDQLLTCASGGVGGHVRIDKSSGTLAVSADLSVNSWTYVRGTVSGLGGGTLTFSDDNQGTFVPGSLTYNNLTVNVGGIYHNFTFGSGIFSFNALTVTGGNLYLNTYNPTLSFSGDVAIGASGTLYAGTNPITVGGSWTNSGSFHHGNGKLVLIGSANTTYTPGSSAYYDLELNKSSASNDLTVSGTATVSGDFIQTNGEMRGGQLDVAGDYVIGAASDGIVMGYSVPTTIVNLNGTGNQAIVYSSGGIGAYVRIDKAGGELTVSDDIKVNSWVYVRGTVTGMDSHTLILGDNCGGSFTPGSLTYQHLEINKSDPNYYGLSLSGTATVTGNLNFVDGETSGGQIDLGGDYTIGSAALGQIGGYGATATVVNFNHAVADQRIIYNAGGIGQTVRVDKAGGNLVVAGDIRVSGWDYVRGAVAGLADHLLNLQDNAHGYFSPGSLTYGDVSINRDGQYYYEFTMRAGSADINGDLSFLDGIIKFNTNNPSINLAGNLTVGSLVTMNKGTGFLTFDGTLPSTYIDLGATSQNLGKVIISKSNADTSQNSLILASDLTCDTMTVNTDNTLDLGSGGHILTLAHAGTTANVLILSGALDGGDGTVRFSATNSTGSINLPLASYENLETSGSETYALTGDTAVAGNLTIGSGSILDTATFDIVLSGDFSNRGTFRAGTNAVTLGGTDQNISGDTSFYFLTKQAAAADTLTFAAGSATAISAGGALTLKGLDRDHRLSLLSSAPDTQWILAVDPAATYDFDYLAVGDSHATTRPLAVLNSLDQGNNTNWTIINNTAAAVTVPQVAVAGSLVTISVTISDADQDDISLAVEYSLDGGTSWHDPHLASVASSLGAPALSDSGAYRITDVATSAPALVTIIWDTQEESNELGAILFAADLRIRLTPFDGTDIGTSQVSAAFEVNNRRSVFIAPIKPDLSGLSIAIEDGVFRFAQLPSNISQVAVSASSAFPDVSYLDISAAIDASGYAADAVYFKFRTTSGGTSDVVAYNRISSGVAVELEEGDIVQTPGSFDVYIIKLAAGRRFKRLILSPRVFESYQHLKWENLKTVSFSQLETYATSFLVRAAGDAIVYELFPAGDTGTKRMLDSSIVYDPDSVYEINGVDRDSYLLTD